MNRGFWQTIKKPIIGLAPMDGVSDAAFRFITAKYGKPSILITEFTNVDALKYGALKALTAFIYNEEERPVVAQIYGTNPENFYRACFIACELGFDGIDINMGCPSKSVTGNGAGAGLILTPLLAQEIIKSCKQACQDWSEGKKIEEVELLPQIIQYIKNAQLGTIPGHFDIDGKPDHFIKKTPFIPERKILPVSVKTRIGYDKPIVEEWLKYVIECEPVNISLHGRTLKQMYTGEANWEEIGNAAKFIKKQNPEILFLGNGDIKSYSGAIQKIQTYNLDGVLIGRGALGQPWILNNETKSISEKLEIAVEHSKTYEHYFGKNPKVFAAMKKHLGWYCTDFPKAKELRLKLMSCNSAEEVKNTLNN